LREQPSDFARPRGATTAPQTASIQVSPVPLWPSAAPKARRGGRPQRGPDVRPRPPRGLCGRRPYGRAAETRAEASLAVRAGACATHCQSTQPRAHSTVSHGGCGAAAGTLCILAMQGNSDDLIPAWQQTKSAHTMRHMHQPITRATHTHTRYTNAHACMRRGTSYGTPCGSCARHTCSVQACVQPCVPPP